MHHIQRSHCRLHRSNQPITVDIGKDQRERESEMTVPKFTPPFGPRANCCSSCTIAITRGNGCLSALPPPSSVHVYDASADFDGYLLGFTCWLVYNAIIVTADDVCAV